eukprot:539060-Amphidinium_carterae.1
MRLTTPPGRFCLPLMSECGILEGSESCNRASYCRGPPLSTNEEGANIVAKSTPAPISVLYLVCKLWSAWASR